jgi:hypothetical protein
MARLRTNDFSRKRGLKSTEALRTYKCELAPQVGFGPARGERERAAA